VNSLFWKVTYEAYEAVIGMRLPVELDPSYPRGRFCGSVHCASTGVPLPSAKIKLQGFEPRSDNFFGIRQHGETDQNGRFDIPAIPAGTYHAFATLPGYVSSASLLPMMSLFGVRTHFEVSYAVLDAALPRVCINAEAPSVLDFRLEVGGSISGTVSWQDGAPAKNNWLKLMLINEEGRRLNHGWFHEETSLCGDAVVGSTDPVGNFRYGCLPPGRYIIGAKTPRLMDYICANAYPGRTPAFVNCASLYYSTGETPYYLEASPVELKSREHISGISIVLPMLDPEP
jgi:hypothetical protein